MNKMKEIKKRAITDIFTSLCSKISFDKITIQQISDECGISKQTFYNYFCDKYELAKFAFLVEAEYTVQTYNNCDLHGAILWILNKLIEQKNYYVNIIKSTAKDTFCTCYLNETIDYYSNCIVQKHGKEALDRSVKYAIEFNCYGSLNLVINWLIGGTREDPNILTAEIISCMPNTLRELFFD